MRIFLSYASSDKDLVSMFATGLEEAGHQVLFDGQAISPGASISAALNEAINSADAVIFFVSKDALQSEWFNKEVSIAVANRYSGRQTRIVPVILDKDTPIPFFLNNYLYLDLSSVKSTREIEESIARLGTSLLQQEPKSDPESELAQRQHGIEIEHELLNLKKLQYEELAKHKGRQLFFLTTVTAMFSMTGLVVFLLHTFAGVELKEFNWLVSALLGAASAMLGSYVYLRREEKEKRRFTSLLENLERRIARMEGHDE